MHPELFEIPLVHLTVKSYGLMIVLGFIAAVSLIRRLSRDVTPHPQFITNAALYSLIAGVVGARIFYVVHHFDQFQGRIGSVFAVWQGGLELLGGVTLAIVVVLLYLRHHRLPVLYYLDVLAVGLMLALAFGRIGCFLNGCCFGKPTSLPWGVRFPYGSFAYRSQVQPDPARGRSRPYFELPDDFFDVFYADGRVVRVLKPFESLTSQQKQFLAEKDMLRSLPVHPTQLYSSANAVFLCLVLYFLRRRTIRTNKKPRFFARAGYVFSTMFILYGITRFLIEYLRDDNPFEYGWWMVYRGGTISQNLGIYLVVLGLCLIVAFRFAKSPNATLTKTKNAATTRR